MIEHTRLSFKNGGIDTEAVDHKNLDHGDRGRLGDSLAPMSDNDLTNFLNASFLRYDD